MLMIDIETQINYSKFISVAELELLVKGSLFTSLRKSKCCYSESITHCPKNDDSDQVKSLENHKKEKPPIISKMSQISK